MTLQECTDLKVSPQYLQTKVFPEWKSACITAMLLGNNHTIIRHTHIQTHKHTVYSSKLMVNVPKTPLKQRDRVHSTVTCVWWWTGRSCRWIWACATRSACVDRQGAGTARHTGSTRCGRCSAGTGQFLVLEQFWSQNYIFIRETMLVTKQYPEVHLILLLR